MTFVSTLEDGALEKSMALCVTLGEDVNPVAAKMKDRTEDFFAAPSFPVLRRSRKIKKKKMMQSNHL